MRTIFWVVFGHLAGIALLLWIGASLNSFINKYANDYAGVITVFSAAFGIYSFTVNLLYHRNRRFHFWMNRLRLMFARTHTYWQPSFDLEFDPAKEAERPQLLEAIWESLHTGKFGSVKKTAETPTTLSACVDDVMCFIFRLDETHLHVHLDRKLLVPSHLYDTYRQKLARLAEEIQRIVNPIDMRYGLVVSFGDGVPNPYYGFFVNRVPVELLQDFQVTFRPDAESTCRIEAGTDHVSIEGGSHVDLFEALSQVLSLRAVPNRVGK